ncbi:MAG TPA: hypothetical protein VGD29_23110 [Actinoplanes sp.]|jgi:hypothetical protein
MPGPQLTALEQQLVDAVIQGELLDLAGEDEPDEATMHSWGPAQTIRAWVIRDIVLGRLAPEPDPRGLGLRGVRIDGRIDLANVAKDLEIRLQNCLLPDGLLLRDARLLGLDLGGCRIGRPADSTESVIDADRFVGRALILNTAVVISSSPDGTLRLDNAHLSRLSCVASQLRNDSGPALHGDNLVVDQNVFLSEGFTAHAVSDLGTVRLLGARIGGQLVCSGSHLSNMSGPGLACDSIQVGGDVFLSDGLTVVAAGNRGAVRLHGADIGGSLSCIGATLANSSGPAFVAETARVDRNLLLRPIGASGSDAGGTMNLADIRIGGTLRLDTTGLRARGPGNRALVNLDGTVYSSLPGPGTVDDWLKLIGEHTPAYAAQPYQQLAAVHRAAGHDHAVRKILMAQRRDQIRRRAVTGWDRVWARLTGLTLGFGYQPWRALLMLLLVLGLSVGAAVTAGHRGGLADTSSSATPRAPCSVTEQIGVGLDLGIPLLRTGARDQCAPTTTDTGQALTVTGWLLQILAWAFAALFIAGFTGAVRKT